ncbi:MAG: hypothetical protein JXA78_17055 [Anaerolineales bacterium]|nr:hypothetical protein [Anaerolineales bacterium]
MKVETDLRAGGVLESAVNQAGQAANQVTGFVGQANQQAESFTSNLVNSITSFWNCLTGSA